ncbi:hypothetical protein [Microbulbifer epialgicus]|uniref:Uncharacterized protein n=1 Tax=Microbulbifer epialgicus TaxID=393907 RepID=A0ABV4NYZ5_9GAMM
MHIGFHKTGSSSLQLALKGHMQALKTQGIEFLTLGKKGNSSSCVDVSKLGEHLAFKVNHRFEELLASKQNVVGTTIISAEHFCFFAAERILSRFAEYVRSILIVFKLSFIYVGKTCRRTHSKSRPPVALL